MLHYLKKKHTWAGIQIQRSKPITLHLRFLLTPSEKAPRKTKNMVCLPKYATQCCWHQHLFGSTFFINIGKRRNATYRCSTSPRYRVHQGEKHINLLATKTQLNADWLAVLYYLYYIYIYTHYIMYPKHPPKWRLHIRHTWEPAKKRPWFHMIFSLKTGSLSIRNQPACCFRFALASIFCSIFARENNNKKHSRKKSLRRWLNQHSSWKSTVGRRSVPIYFNRKVDVICIVHVADTTQVSNRKYIFNWSMLLLCFFT